MDALERKKAEMKRDCKVPPSQVGKKNISSETMDRVISDFEEALKDADIPKDWVYGDSDTKKHSPYFDDGVEMVGQMFADYYAKHLMERKKIKDMDLILGVIKGIDIVITMNEERNPVGMKALRLMISTLIRQSGSEKILSRIRSEYEKKEGDEE